MKFCTLVDIIAIYIWDFFSDFLQRKNTNFEVFKKRATWSSGSKMPLSPSTQFFQLCTSASMLFRFLRGVIGSKIQNMLYAYLV